MGAALRPRRRGGHPWTHGAGRGLVSQLPASGTREGRRGASASRTCSSARHVNSAKAGSASSQVRTPRQNVVGGARIELLGFLGPPLRRVQSRREAPCESARRCSACGARVARTSPSGRRPLPAPGAGLLAPPRRGQWKNPAFGVGDPGPRPRAEPGADLTREEPQSTPPPGFE